MKPLIVPGHRLVWLSPIVGAIAPATYLSLSNSLSGHAAGILSAFVVWFLRDLIVGYSVALPVLAVLWRLGVRHLVVLWSAAALVAGPVGYVLANPVRFAWTPTEEQFEHGPYWIIMLVYMALFGLTGLVFAFLSNRQVRRAMEGTHAA